jgi:cytochrome c peroxidase
MGQTMTVSSASGCVHAEIFLQDQTSQVLVRDDQGFLATPTWFNGNLFGDNAYTLSLGMGGAYANLSVAYTDEATPQAGTPRAPTLVTPSLIRGVVAAPYALRAEAWMVAAGISPSQQIRADGGIPPLAYQITSGALPPGLSLATQLVSPTDDGSPPQWLGVLQGTPTLAGAYPFTVQVTDATGAIASGQYTLTVDASSAPTVSFTESFTGANGAKINDVPGSAWTGRYGAAQTSATFANDTALLGPWQTLTALPLFRNATSRYLHLGARMLGGRAGMLSFLCATPGAYGIRAAWDGVHTLTVQSNNLGYAPQTATDSLAAVARATGDVLVDVYLEGAYSRVYVTDSSGMHATGGRVGPQLLGACATGNYVLSLGYGGQYADVLVEDVPTVPALVNPVAFAQTVLLGGFEGVDYRDLVTATAGAPPFTFSATGLPPGLGVAPDGAVAGTPTVPGVYAATFSVTDAIGEVATTASTITIEADPQHDLLFADRFSLPDGLFAAQRDADHWSSLPNTPTALTYTGGRLSVDPHEQGFTTQSFDNDGADPLQFRLTMTKGKVGVFQVGTCWGMEVAYDGVQLITLRWNDLCYDPYMLQQDFLLASMGDVVAVTLEVKGQWFSARIDSSAGTYIRGPFQASRVVVGQPVFLHLRDNTPYGAGQYNSYVAGPSFVDDLTVRHGLWTALDFEPIPAEEELGRLLFYDPILSGDDRRACAGCHLPARGRADGRPTARAIDGHALERNTVALTNVALAGAFFRDGRATDLGQVALQPLQNPDEMNETAANLTAQLSAIPEYEARFGALYPDGPTIENVSSALAAYVRTLMELRTPYDANLYVQGTLSAQADAGLILFNGKANCSSCHSLAQVTGCDTTVYSLADYEVTGVPADAAGTTLDADPGRQAVTGAAADLRAFLVPGLRDLSRSGPYMHNGVFATLAQVVEFYDAGGGLGLGLAVPEQSPGIVPLGLTATERAELVAFLQSLSPTIPNYAPVPEAVPSGLPVGGVE